jgi:hypothetical protein
MLFNDETSERLVSATGVSKTESAWTEPPRNPTTAASPTSMAPTWDFRKWNIGVTKKVGLMSAGGAIPPHRFVIVEL